MNSIKLLNLFIGLSFCILIEAQNAKQKVIVSPDEWTVFNREVSFKKDVIHLDAKPNDGLLWLNGSNFKNGIIELDIKGKNAPGQSFVGVAFHGTDDNNYDAVYFRPFNFKNPKRNSNSIQYISMPENNWYVLRKAFPGKYENAINPVPQPDDWFHAKIVVNFPNVKVYVNGSDTITLEIEQISTRKKGKVGLWVGNNSEGWFKNLKITEGN